MPRLLNQNEIDKKLEHLNDWKQEDKFITKTIEFDTFSDGIRFIDQVAKVADEKTTIRISM